MMVWSIVFGVFALWITGLTLQAAGFKRATIAAGLALYGLSHGIWYFSSTANQNSTPLALHIITLYAIIWTLKDLPNCPSKERIIGIGVLTSLAVLSSQANLVLLLPMVYLLVVCVSKPRAKIGNLILYIVTIIIVSAALWAYLAYVVLGIRSYAGFVDWQHSYVVFPAYWAQDLADSLKRSLRGAVDLHIAYAFQSGSIFGGWEKGVKSLPLKIGQAIVLIFFVVITIRAFIGWLLVRPRSHVQNIGLLTSLPVLLFTFVFTPEQIHHRVLYLPGFLLFAGHMIEHDSALGLPSFRRTWPLVVVIACLFLANFASKFLPGSNLSNNELWVEAKQLSKQFGLKDQIIYLSAYEGDFRIKYTRYFTRCTVHRVIDIVRELRAGPERVKNFLRPGTKAGGVVVVHADAFYSSDGYGWINKRFGLNIQPDEIRHFFESNFEMVDHIMIHDKAYIIFRPTPGYTGV
jgi:hypothetical protein